MSNDSATDIASEILQQLSDEFDVLCQERHTMGAEKYGAGSFVGVDTLEMAIHEVLDLANYARYTFIRLRLLQQGMIEFVADGSVEKPLPGKEHLGDLVADPTGFFSFRRTKSKDGSGA